MILRETAKDIYTHLRKISIKIIWELGCLPLPSDPVRRLRPWLRGSPRGIGFHYTGGTSGIKALKWFNNPKWENTSSSCHVLIFDRKPQNVVGELWDKYVGKDLQEFFPVPILLLADWSTATWCTNWMNGHCLGVENRNIGRRNTCVIFESLDKRATYCGGFYYEPYTQEQLVCNINLGRLFRHYLPEGQLDPDYLVGHSGVWAVKNDPGPAFPIHLIRNAIFNNAPINSLLWLLAYPKASGIAENENYWQVFQGDYRDNANVPKIIIDEKYAEEPIEDAREDVVSALYKLGFNCGPGEISDKQLSMFVSWYQCSTKAYKKVGRPEDVLVVDGIAGPMTQDSLVNRLIQLGMTI